MTVLRENPMNEHLDVDPVGSTRPVVRGREGIVTSGHHLTSMAAMRMLLDGGNAFDAAVAAGFAADSDRTDRGLLACW